MCVQIVSSQAVSDPSSPDGPDTSTPQLLEEIDSPDSDAERPTLQVGVLVTFQV